jgi:hypothetical protein
LWTREQATEVGLKSEGNNGHGDGGGDGSGSRRRHGREIKDERKREGGSVFFFFFRKENSVATWTWQNFPHIILLIKCATQGGV